MENMENLKPFIELCGKYVKFKMRDGSAVTGYVRSFTPWFDNEPEISTLSVFRSLETHIAGLEIDIPEIASYEILK